MRISAIMNELNGEKIDIIAWSENPLEYIARALSPAKVLQVKQLDDKSARVIVPDDKLSLAIGKSGQNARLAVKLTGWKIDIKSESVARQEGFLEDEEIVSEEE
jgi:N utilization substance protein A